MKACNCVDSVMGCAEAAGGAASAPPSAGCGVRNSSTAARTQRELFQLDMSSLIELASALANTAPRQTRPRLNSLRASSAFSCGKLSSCPVIGAGSSKADMRVSASSICFERLSNWPRHTFCVCSETAANTRNTIVITNTPNNSEICRQSQVLEERKAKTQNRIEKTAMAMMAYME